MHFVARSGACILIRHTLATQTNGANANNFTTLRRVYVSCLAEAKGNNPISASRRFSKRFRVPRTILEIGGKMNKTPMVMEVTYLLGKVFVSFSDGTTAVLLPGQVYALARDASDYYSSHITREAA